MKYALDNIIDIIDGACNWYVLTYLILCLVTIVDKRIIPFSTFKDWVNIGVFIALAGMIFIPSKEQRKDMNKRKNK